MTESEIEAILERFTDMVAKKVANELSTYWLTREEYAERNKISLRTVDKIIADELIETRRVGRRILLANISAWQVYGTKMTEGDKAGASGTTGKRNRNQSGSVL